MLASLVDVGRNELARFHIAALMEFEVFGLLPICDVSSSPIRPSIFCLLVPFVGDCLVGIRPICFYVRGDIYAYGLPGERREVHNSIIVFDLGFAEPTHSIYDIRIVRG